MLEPYLYYRTPAIDGMEFTGDETSIGDVIARLERLRQEHGELPCYSSFSGVMMSAAPQCQNLPDDPAYVRL